MTDELRNAIAALPEDLAAMVRMELDAEYERIAELDAHLTKAVAQARITRAEEELGDWAWVHDDLTGQDADHPGYMEAIQNKLQAEDEYIRDTDPDRYSEMKYMYGGMR